MLIFDKVYGEHNIEEPVILELINSRSVQRLKKISQHGMPQEYYHKTVFSRYDHSIGVMLLLKKLDADLEERIAGLLHDISHTAFSHVIDWVIGDPSKEDYQDNIFSEYLKKSEIPDILKRYSISLDRIVKIDSFSLLERESPGLCADRIDYCLRELVDLNKSGIVNEILSNLTQINGQITFKTEKSAELFGIEYLKLQKEHWGGIEARARYYLLANVLKTAIKMNIISAENFHDTDCDIIDRLVKTDNNEILTGLKKLKSGFRIKESSSNDGIKLIKKFRYVDPEVIINGRIIRLSYLSDSFNRLIEEESDNSVKNIFVKID